jgi:FlaA1/EpsC-like NDP-sugar epimerase
MTSRETKESRQLREVTEMSGRLAGKVCVITGTGGSMGRATALMFAVRARRSSAAT